MDDQFGGRTDDDLFFDDFEPVEGEAIAVPVPEPTPVEEPQAQTFEPQQPAVQSSVSSLPPPKTLANSRFADKPIPSTAPAPQPISKAPPNAPTAPRDRREAGQNTAGGISRLQSGANPRTKLTEEELAEKMAKMKLLAAEQTRKFEMAERDEKEHAEAYARGMEEARRRREAALERAKRGEEDRRRMEDERAKNRERKLKAIGTKEGGWDEGKEAVEEEEARRGFRGANGGIRGSRRGGLAGSRYATQDSEEHDVDRFLDERYRSRGNRGRRGGRGGGRGGRGGHDGHDGHEGPVVAHVQQRQQAIPKAEDFPALPSEGVKKMEAAAKADASAKPMAPPALPPLVSGKWDDEMEEFDELNRKK